MKIKKLGALLVSAALCAGMAAPAFAFEGEAAPVEQPVLPEVVVEDVVTVTDETSGALTPEGNLTLVDDYHTNYSDGSGQQFITLVSKSGNTFYLVIDRNAKGQQTVHFMNLVDEADLLALMEEDAADAYTAEKEESTKQLKEDVQKTDSTPIASSAPAEENSEKKNDLNEIHALLEKAYDTFQDEDGWVNVAKVGLFLRRAKPDFDSRTYGFQKLSLFLKNFPEKYDVKIVGEKPNTIAVYRCVSNENN